MVSKVHIKRTANVSVCHISGIFTPSVRLFETQRLLGDLYPVMYNFPNDVYFP